MNRKTEYIILTHYRTSDICVELLKQSVNKHWQDLVGAYGDYVYVYEVGRICLKLTLHCYIDELATGEFILESSTKRLLKKFEKFFLKKP